MLPWFLSIEAVLGYSLWKIVIESMHEKSTIHNGERALDASDTYKAHVRFLCFCVPGAAVTLSLLCNILPYSTIRCVTFPGIFIRHHLTRLKKYRSSHTFKNEVLCAQQN